MSDAQLSFRKSANIDRVTDKRKDSLFRLVDTDGSGTIDAQEFAVLYDAIKKDLAEELEKEAALQQEASSARRRFKMLLLFVAVLVSFLAASVAANFAVIFTVVDQAVTTTTTSSGLLEVKGTNSIAKTAIATEDVPLIAAPALDLDTLAQVKSLKVTYGPEHARVEAQLNIVGVRKHNSTFVEFITDVPGETVEALNGKSSLVRYTKKDAIRPQKHPLCVANATCSAFSASGIDVDAVTENAISSLVEHGFLEESRRLQAIDPSCTGGGSWTTDTCSGSGCGTGIIQAEWLYHTGYTGLQHVVFGLHGLVNTPAATPPGNANGGGPGQMNKMCGCSAAVPCTSDCDNFEIDEFRHLVFVFPSSSLEPNVFQYAWNTNTGSTYSYDTGLANLATLICGNADALDDECDGTGALSALNIETDSEVMMMGMSNGGGISTYGHVSKVKVTAAVAVDFYAAYDLATWLPASAGSTLMMKIYTACDSDLYSDLGIQSGSVTFASVYGMTAGAAYAAVYPAGGNAPAGFTEFPFDGAGASLKYAVHGISNTGCDQATICHEGMQEKKSDPDWQCYGVQVHVWLNSYADYVNDVLDWIVPPSPPPSPPSTGGPTVYPAIKPGKKLVKGPLIEKERKVMKQADIPSSALKPFTPATKGFPKITEPSPISPKSMGEAEKYMFGKPAPTLSFGRSFRKF